MKTTIELPDQLLIDAKAAAVRRRTTLKAMIEHALTREIYRDPPASGGGVRCFSIDEHGLPVFGESDEPVVTSEMVYDMMDELGV